jgi:hypothetical protein
LFFRFTYKGAPCAVRQEGFRKAWELLPKCVLVGKVTKATDGDGAVGKSKGAHKHGHDHDDDDDVVVGGRGVEGDTIGAKEGNKLEKGQRRVVSIIYSLLSFSARSYQWSL